MSYKAKVAITKAQMNIGTPGEYSREQLDEVKRMVRSVADGSMGGMQNIVKAGDHVVIKINTVVASPAANGFTTDPRVLEAVIELLKEHNPGSIKIIERCAQGADTLAAMEGCGIGDVARRTGVELRPLENEEWEMFDSGINSSFREFPVAKIIKDADVYIGLPKMKVHIHTGITNALKLQFGCLPDYHWMAECHRDDIYQKITNLNIANKATWFLVDCLYACQGNGPFSPYPDDLIKDFNVMYGGKDPVALDTVCEAIMDWDQPGTNPATVCAARYGLGTNKLEEIEIVGEPIDQVKRRFNKADTALTGVFEGVNVIVGSACEPGCRVLVRMALDALKVNGVLARRKEPLTIFTGLQFEPYITDAEGDIIVYGDCAKKMLDFYPDAKYFGSSEEHRPCTPIWSNKPVIGLVPYITSISPEA